MREYTTEQAPSKIKRLYDMVRALSRENDMQAKHVSVIMRRTEILSIGVNKRKTHPKAQEYGYHYDWVHAELDALLKLPQSQSRDNLTLVNFRVDPRGNFRLSKPCSKCLPWCSGVFREIWYTTSDDKIIRMKP